MAPGVADVRATTDARTNRAISLAAVAATFFALSLLALGLYAPAITHFFIADDLTNLHFVRSHDGPLTSFFVPGQMFSAPVTRSRYMPLHMVHWWVANAAFGDASWAYHVASLVQHAAAATVLVLLARALFRAPWTVAIAVGLLFAASRLNAQTAVWISAGYRATSAALLFSSVLLLVVVQRRRTAVVGSLALYATGLLMNPDLVIGPVVYGAFAADAWWTSRRRMPSSTTPDPQRSVRDEAGRHTLAALGAGALAAGFVCANLVSRARFPDPMSFGALPRLDRLAAFLGNLVVPFEASLTAKLLGVALVACGTILARQRYTGALLVSVLASALLWSSGNQPIAPRYLYIPAGFLTIACVQAGWRAFAALASKLACPAAARWTGTALVAGWMALHLWTVRQVDLPTFAYQATLPHRLHQLALTAPGARVLVTPVSNLPAADLAFFEGRLKFVRDASEATHVVQTGVDAYRARFGPRFGVAYWYLPWFTGPSAQPRSRRSRRRCDAIRTNPRGHFVRTSLHVWAWVPRRTRRGRLELVHAAPRQVCAPVRNPGPRPAS